MSVCLEHLRMALSRNSIPFRILNSGLKKIKNHSKNAVVFLNLKLEQYTNADGTFNFLKCIQRFFRSSGVNVHYQVTHITFSH
jgi:hypothetical protein